MHLLYGQRTGMEFARIGNDYMLTRGGEVRILNRTAYGIWEQFGTPKTIDQVVEDTVASFSSAPSMDTLQAEVRDCVDQLLSLGLIHVVEI